MAARGGFEDETPSSERRCVAQVRVGGASGETLSGFDGGDKDLLWEDRFALRYQRRDRSADPRDAPTSGRRDSNCSFSVTLGHDMDTGSPKECLT